MAGEGEIGAMSSEKVYFEENSSFYWKKRLKKLAFGLFLMLVPPVLLFWMFWYLIFWSSLFPQETGMVLLFLLLTPWFGAFFVVKALAMPRMRVYATWLPNPTLLGKRRIPLNDIKYVAEKYVSEDGPRTFTLYMKQKSDSTRDRSPVLGVFLESDAGPLTKALRDRGVEVKLE